MWLIRLLTWAGALLAGGAYGVAGTVMHSAMVLEFAPGGFPIVLPVGLIVAAIGSLALLVAVRCLADDRGTVLAAGLGMLAMLLVYSGRGPGGSVIVPQAAPGEPPLGLIWSWVLAAAVVLVVAWPDLRGVRRTPLPEDRAGGDA